jgi:DNA-binding XRE family transcriptional regulator
MRVLHNLGVKLYRKALRRKGVPMTRTKTKREKVQLGRQLRTMRKKAGISEAMMAVNLEVTVRTILNYETGATCAPKAVVLAYEHFTGFTMAGLGKGGSSCEQDSLFETCGVNLSATVDKTPIAA